MKRYAAILVLCSLFILKGYSTAHAETFSNLSLEHIMVLRQAAAGDSLSEYISLAELVIEWIEKERPDIAGKAAGYYLRLPGIVEELKDGARQTGSAGIDAAPVMDFEELDAEIGRWIADKTASMKAGLRSAEANIEIAHRALAEIAGLVGIRERKQQLIADVILLIADVLGEEDGRDRELHDPEIERGKGNKLKPSAVGGPKSDRLPRYAIKE